MLHLLRYGKAGYFWKACFSFSFLANIALIAGSLFMLAQVIIITINGAVYWYESKIVFLIGDFIVCGGGMWLGINRLKDDIKNR